MQQQRPLTIPSGRSFTINMDGATLSRELSTAVSNGNVITVEEGAELTLNGGTVTGGNSRLQVEKVMAYLHVLYLGLVLDPRQRNLLRVVFHYPYKCLTSLRSSDIN